MEQHSKTLIDQLDEKIHSTYQKAPTLRRAGETYELGRIERPDPIGRERYLEKLLWQQWGHDVVMSGGQPFFGVECRFIQTYQMPLQEKREDRGWGRVDLVGATADSMPVVIELKQEKSKDNPLRMLVEALAYACALRKAWNEGLLAIEWKAAMKGHNIGFTNTGRIAEVPIVLLAPAAFWKRRIGTLGKRSNSQVPGAAWSPFCQLARNCRTYGYPVHFAKFDINENGSDREKVSQGSTVSLPGFEEVDEFVAGR